VALAPSLRSVGGVAEPDVEVVFAHVVRALLETGRASDVVGRCGEREIAVVAADTGAEGAEKLVGRLRAALERVPLYRDGRTVLLDVDAGFRASEDFAQSPIGVMDMLFQASIALRGSPEGTSSHHPQRTASDS
jgi:GGDEF domain-containing protein